MTDDERLARNMAKLDAQRAIREREAAAIKSQRDTAAGKRDEYGNPPVRKRPAKRRKGQRPVESHAETLERRARIVALYEQGRSGVAVAKEVGVTSSTVYESLRAAGVARRSASDAWHFRAREMSEAGEPLTMLRKPVVIDVEELAARYRAGATVAELAREFNVGATTVHKRLTKAGVTMRAAARRVTA